MVVIIVVVSSAVSLVDEKPFDDDGVEQICVDDVAFYGTEDCWVVDEKVVKVAVSGYGAEIVVEVGSQNFSVLVMELDVDIVIVENCML